MGKIKRRNIALNMSEFQKLGHIKESLFTQNADIQAIKTTTNITHQFIKREQ